MPAAPHFQRQLHRMTRRAPAPMCLIPREITSGGGISTARPVAVIVRLCLRKKFGSTLHDDQNRVVTYFLILALENIRTHIG
jgi:hypothetical protein